MRAKPQVLPGLALSLATWMAHAGGPRYVAGATYFDTAAQGQPVVWAGGSVRYFTDQGDLSASVSRAQADATVAAAAAVWSAVPTAAVSIQSGGTLAENVDGSNVLATSTGVALPADVRSTATATPVGIVYDEDGAVIDALFGSGASDPDDCIDSGVMNIVDNLAPNGTIAHALILIDGRCTGSAAQLEQIEFQLIRAFGRVLGLGWAQANDTILTADGGPSLRQLEGWPVMRPIDANCNQLSTQCVPKPLQLRPDDTASLSRLYPVTSANLAQYPGKQVTAIATASIHGSVYFRTGQGMQGVNIVARPIQPGVSLPDDRYPVAAVSGFLYTGNGGNAVTGALDAAGAPLSNFGSADTLVEGLYDLSGIPLPPGETSASYQLTLEPVDPLYTGSITVGPYSLGSPAPSGTLPAITVNGVTAGSSLEQDLTIADSAGDENAASGGTFAAPGSLPANGTWEGRMAAPGATAWFALPAAAGHHFTLEVHALNDTGAASEDKMLPVIGVWDPAGPEGSAAGNAALAPFNGAGIGITSLGVDPEGDSGLLLAITDRRGDGRPDYIYHGRLLYAATVTPARLPLGGGQLQIAGSGFRPGMRVSLGSRIMATVVSITPTLIVADAPAVSGETGSLDLSVYDPATNGLAEIGGGIGYVAGAQASVSAPMRQPSGFGALPRNTPSTYRPADPAAPAAFSFRCNSGDNAWDDGDVGPCPSAIPPDVAPEVDPDVTRVRP